MRYLFIGFCMLLSACGSIHKEYLVLQPDGSLTSSGYTPTAVNPETLTFYTPQPIKPQSQYPSNINWQNNATNTLPITTQNLISPNQFPTESATLPSQNTMMQKNCPYFVILQHPENRDLVKCLLCDSACVLNYEQYGYVQLKYTPRFSGYQDLPNPSDYPSTDINTLYAQ